MASSSRGQSGSRRGGAGQDRSSSESDQKPHLRSRPTLKNLLDELETIVKWQRLLLNLGIEKHKLDIIERNRLGDVRLQKTDALELWLRETPEACWRIVIDALYDMDENTLASHLSKKYAFEDPRPSVRVRFISTPSNGEVIRPEAVPVDQIPKSLAYSEYGYYTVNLTRSIPYNYVARHKFFAGLMEGKLTDFLRSIERSEYKDDYKVGIEARFGKSYWKVPTGGTLWPPQCFENMLSTLRRNRVFNPEVTNSDIDHFLRAGLGGRECINEITRIPRVQIIVEGVDEGNYIAVVDEDRGMFTLDAVYRKQAVENRARFDFAIPGRKYDFRIGECSAPLLSESEHSLPCKIAREVTRSMHRLPNRKLSMILRGETPKGESTWKVKFIRQRVQKQYHWKPDKKWILVQYDVDEFDATTNTSVNIDETPVNTVVEIPEFNYSRKEIELWGLKIFPKNVNETRPSREKCYYMESVGGVKFPEEYPQEPLNWRAEDLMKDFEEFVGDAFYIAAILDSAH